MTRVSFKSSFWLTIILALMTIYMGGSTVPVSDSLDRVRAFTRSMEFDYISWTINALGIKLGQMALDTASYLPVQDQSKTVLAALELINHINQVKSKLNDVYSDPTISDPKAASIDLRNQLTNLLNQRDELARDVWWQEHPPGVPPHLGEPGRGPGEHGLQHPAGFEAELLADPGNPGERLGGAENRVHGPKTKERDAAGLGQILEDFPLLALLALGIRHGLGELGEGDGLEAHEGQGKILPLEKIGHGQDVVRQIARLVAVEIETDQEFEP